MLLQSARGPIPNLPELVVGAPITGSWWGHPDHDEIFRVLNEAAGSPDVVRLRLVRDKVTLVHQRLWPALARLAPELGPRRLTAHVEEHTASGAHRRREVPFPEWLPADAARKGAELGSDEEAWALLPDCLRPRRAAG